MPETEREYSYFLTDIDMVIVRQVRDKGNIIGFSVQYMALIQSRWRKITRFDNAHGTPHRHVFYPSKGREHKYPMTTINSNEAFTEAQIVIKNTFMHMRDTYIISMERMR